MSREKLHQQKSKLDKGQEFFHEEFIHNYYSWASCGSVMQVESTRPSLCIVSICMSGYLYATRILASLILFFLWHQPKKNERKMRLLSCIMHVQGMLQKCIPHSQLLLVSLHTSSTYFHNVGVWKDLYLHQLLLLQQQTLTRNSQWHDPVVNMHSE